MKVDDQCKNINSSNRYFKAGLTKLPNLLIYQQFFTGSFFIRISKITLL